MIDVKLAFRVCISEIHTAILFRKQGNSHAPISYFDEHLICLPDSVLLRSKYRNLLIVLSGGSIKISHIKIAPELRLTSNTVVINNDQR